MSRTSEVTAEIHGFSVPGATPTPWNAALEQFVVRDGAVARAVFRGRSPVFRVRPARGLGFAHGERSSRTTWTFPS